MSRENQLRVGMISWAHVHAEFRAKALSEIPTARIVAISDDDEERGRHAADRFGVANFSTDWRHVVERDDVDVVFVHSENALHAEQVIACAEAGKDVFCEKPIATDLVDADRMVDAVERAGVAVSERIPCIAAPLGSTETYLRTKKTKMGHLLEEI